MRIPLHLGILLLWTGIAGAGHLPAAAVKGEPPEEPGLIAEVPPFPVVEFRSGDEFEDGKTPAASCGGLPTRRVVDPVVPPVTGQPAGSVALYKLHRSFLI